MITIPDLVLIIVVIWLVGYVLYQGSISRLNFKYLKDSHDLEIQSTKDRFQIRDNFSEIVNSWINLLNEKHNLLHEQVTTIEAIIEKVIIRIDDNDLSIAEDRLALEGHLKMIFDNSNKLKSMLSTLENVQQHVDRLEKKHD